MPICEDCEREYINGPEEIHGCDPRHLLEVVTRERDAYRSKLADMVAFTQGWGLPRKAEDARARSIALLRGDRPTSAKNTEEP